MNIQKLTKKLQKPSTSKIIFIVADGLGGLPQTKEGKTELETANTPNLDDLAAKNVCGLITPVLPGITPGSGPGHLGLFGYDPLEWEIGRGVLEALGVDFELAENDIASRGNFCTVNERGEITDRRAGRISTETCKKLVEKLRKIRIPDAEIFVEPVQDYRFVLIIRGNGLEGDIEDTDPQKLNVPPLIAKPKNSNSKAAANIVNEFVKQAKVILKEDHPANMLTLRGFGEKPVIPSMSETYGISTTASCVYPMYRGLARLVGMKISEPVKNLQDQLEYLKENWNNFDYFFVHYKYTDSRGEDGKFEEKVKCIEELDSYIPKFLHLNPDVFVLTGDHSSPAIMKAHSWHPVPVLLASKYCRPDQVKQFGESQCLQGGLGQFESKYLILHILANADRLQKFGA